jgi:hypothetical protein
MPAGDPVRAAEVQQAVMTAKIKEHDREARVRQEFQRRQFLEKYNQLVQALEAFSKRYNEGKGNIWPQHEVDNLRKAMHQIQQVESSLREDADTPARHASADRQN